MLENGNSNILLLDATLRDGGLGLEDAYINGLSDDGYTLEQRKTIAELNRDAGVDIIEIGSIEPSGRDKTRFSIYQDIQDASLNIPARRSPGQLFVSMFRGPDTPFDKLPEHRADLLDGVRVILRYSELQKSLDFCKVLADKGFMMFIQPMLTMRYTQAELMHVIECANEMHAVALYFVDSYGYMQERDVIRLFDLYNERLDPSIAIGFHAHNNMNLAFSNALAFIRHAGERKVMVDSCATGMGQGTGNLQTEIIANWLNSECGKHYDYSKILDVCEIVSTFLRDNTWGYSVTRLLPAIHEVAYKYAVALRCKYHWTFNQINELFKKMPYEMKQRYTAESLETLLKSTK